jgi:hypothetical protein
MGLENSYRHDQLQWSSLSNHDISLRQIRSTTGEWSEGYGYHCWDLVAEVGSSNCVVIRIRLRRSNSSAIWAARLNRGWG